MSSHKILSFALCNVAACLGCIAALGQPVNEQEKPIAEANANGDASADRAAVGPALSAGEKPLPAGRAVSRSYEFGDEKIQLSYRLYLPKGYYERLAEDNTSKFPLIVALHGYGSNPTQVVGYPEFTRHANEHCCIIVAPMGYNAAGWYGSRGPGGGRGSDPNNLGELSEKDVMQVLELTRQAFPIDENRIYLYGHSMGGGGAIYLGAKYPEIWAAIAPMAPAIPTVRVNLEQAKHIPVFMVHGDNDRVLPVRAARRWVEKLQQADVPHRYIEVEGGDHVTVAFRYFGEMFEFFEKNPRRAVAEAEAPR